MAAVSIHGLRKTMHSTGGRSVLVINELSIEAWDGEFVCLLGPSGCGKTTLLNIVAGLTPPDSGDVVIESRPDGAEARIGYVFQTPRLLDWKKSWENVALPLRARGYSSDDAEERAREYLGMVGLSQEAERFPLHCSEGERARVGLARALAIDPDVLLMDEPMSHLDELTARRLRSELLGVWRQQGTTVLFVTHNALEAAYLADRVYVLSPRPARIVGEVVIDLARPRRPEGDDILRYQREILAKMGVT